MHLLLPLLLACGLDLGSASLPEPPPPPPTPTTTAPTTAPTTPPATDPTVAALQAAPLAYTRHARCRMDCRRVDEADVTAILAQGGLVPERTRLDGQCPSHALEGRDDEGRQLRVALAECPGETRVVTVVDLDNDWPCDCD